MTSKNVDWKPRVDLEFENVEAWEFWNEYNRKVGFGDKDNFCNISFFLKIN